MYTFVESIIRMMNLEGIEMIGIVSQFVSRRMRDEVLSKGKRC